MDKKYNPLLRVAYEIVTGVPPRKITTEDRKKALTAFVVWLIVMVTLFLNFNVLHFIVGVSLVIISMAHFLLYIRIKLFSMPMFYEYSEAIQHKHTQLIEEFKLISDVISIEEFASKVLERETQKRITEVEAERMEILNKYEIDRKA